ncbi:hypothetical protein ES702_07673 [subsurface metagenome]
MFLVAIKNPAANFLVDSYDDLFKDEEVMKFTQDGLLLIIPLHVNSNIAYINELSEEQVETFKESIRQAAGRIETIKPGFKFPKKRSN